MDHSQIRFNLPYLTGNEVVKISEVLQSRKFSGDGTFTRKCHKFFEENFGFRKVLLTTSCSDALEMASLLIDVQPGDEVIVPSFTFVSSANAFMLRGAKIVFADSGPDNPNINAYEIETLINKRTKAIVVVHYAGVACDMEKILSIARKHNVIVIEDAAHSIASHYKGVYPLGTLGTLATFSFHETKNIISGEGGMLVVNDERLIKRAEIVWEKGTNRSAFWRGEVDKYNWVDLGSSFLPSDLIAAFLYAQLENLDRIQARRIEVWNRYYQGLKPLAESGKLELPFIPEYATNNGHMFYVVCKNESTREALIAHLREYHINAVFHYLSLHKSPFFKNLHDGRELPNSDRFTECLLRLPFYYELTHEDQDRVIDKIQEFYGS